MTGLIFLGIALAIVVGSVKQVREYERGVKFMFGKYHGIMGPGWRLVFPVIQDYQLVDLRVKVTDVPDQDAITKDNITIRINAVIYYEVMNAEATVLKVEHVHDAVAQLAQTTMRDAVGEVELDTLLTKRSEVSERIRGIMDKTTDPWGIKVNAVELKHLELPEVLQRTMAKQAEAERERRAIIIKAEGEKVAAHNIAAAAKTLAGAPGALHLRTLEVLNDLSSDQSNTVIFAIPIEVLQAVEGIANAYKKMGDSSADAGQTDGE